MNELSVSIIVYLLNASFLSRLAAFAVGVCEVCTITGFEAYKSVSSQAVKSETSFCADFLCLRKERKKKKEKHCHYATA